MLYIITFTLFLLWVIWVIKKENLTWHSIISIYVITLFVVDFGDVPLDFWFNLYDLPVHMLNNIDAGNYLGIVFSDGLIFPLVAIVFCCYSVRYHNPWLLSILFASMLGLMEVFYVKLGYMVYNHWNHLITPVISLGWLRILAHFADRFVNYSPPISYHFRLLCAIYVITEWPGAIMGGVLRLYYYRPNIFDNHTADDRFAAMLLATSVGALAAIVIPKIRDNYKGYLFAALGVFSVFFALWMHAKGILIYNHWNNFYTVIRYTIPYIIVYQYEHWELVYTREIQIEQKI